jgi:ketosteroid isomerase-like protein
MKRLAFFAALSATALLTFSQMGCQRGADTNRANSTAAAPNSNSGKETVDTVTIEKELMRIEKDWPRVLKEKDAEAVRRVEADDVVIIYPDGMLGSKAEDVRDMETGALSADSWEISDLKVTVLDNNAAFASGRNIIKGGKAKTPDGKTVDISGEYRWIDTFARRNGQWKLVASIGTPVQKPAGATTTPAATKASPAVAKPAASAEKSKP